MVYLFIIGSYLVGSIPTGLVLAKLTGGEDIRKSGSGNIGATNVTRLLGRKLGALTLAGDILKAVLPMLAMHWYMVRSGSYSPADIDMAISVCGGAAFLGHLFPLYLNFKGGKGVATALGVFIILEPVAVLISIFLFAATVYFSGFVSVGSLLVSGLMTAWIWLLGGSPNHVVLAFIVGVLIWIKHADNIRRLMDGTEKGWKKKGGRNSEPQ